MIMPDNLPDTWATECLGDLVYLAGRIGWRGLKADEYTKSGPLLLSVYCLNQGDVVTYEHANHISLDRFNESPEIVVHENDILLTKDGAGIGKLGIVIGLPSKATINSSLLLIRPLEALVPKYLYYCLVGPEMQRIVKSRITGSTTPHLFQRDIKTFEIAVPPLPEQSRIVARIEALQARSQKAWEAIEAVGPLLEQFRQSVLAAAFRGDLTADWRAKHPNTEPASVLLESIRHKRRQKWEAANPKKKYVEPEPVDESDLLDLPEGWCWATLDELSVLITDGEHISPVTTETGIPLLSAKDVRDEGVIFDDIKYVSSGDAERFWNRCRPENGDLLIVSRGATIGRSTILNTDKPFCLMGSVILAKLHDLTIANHVCHFMKSHFALKQLRSSLKCFIHNGTVGVVS